jgi:hypothetical protein
MGKEVTFVEEIAQDEPLPKWRAALAIGTVVGAILLIFSPRVIGNHQIKGPP